MAAGGIFLATPAATGEGPGSRSRICSTPRPDHDVRLGDLRGARPGQECSIRPPCRSGRLRERRQDEPARVRLRGHVGERTLRHRPESPRFRPDRRRLVRRFRCGAGSGPRRSCARNRLRRLDPHSCSVLRRGRFQADLRPRLDRRLLSARTQLRPRRTDGAERHRLRCAPRGDRAGVHGRGGQLPRRRCRRRGLARGRRSARRRTRRRCGGAISPKPYARLAAAPHRLPLHA